MVFDGLKNMFKPRNVDVFDTKGLEGFTDVQKKRIIDKIRSKEIQLMDNKADALADKRITILERKFGIKPSKELAKSKNFKEVRLANIEKKVERESVFRKSDKPVSDPKFMVKDLPIQLSTPQVKVLDKVLETKPEKRRTIKEVKLKAPPTSLL